MMLFVESLLREQRICCFLLQSRCFCSQNGLLFYSCFFPQFNQRILQNLFQSRFLLFDLF